MNVKEMRAMTGLSQSKFAAMFNIPKGTFQAWEQGRQEPPAYVTSMMERILVLTKPAENFNPMYDSQFMISRDNDKQCEHRYLVELYPEELIELRAEINAVLERRPNDECQC